MFEHTAPAIRKELKAGQASLVVSSEESTTALNEFETFDLMKEVQELGSDTIVMWTATSLCPRVETALALVNMLTDNSHSYNEVVETISQFIFEKEETIQSF